MNYKKFAFDLDGTLIDDHFKLKDGVVDFFYNLLKNLNEPEIVICSGSSNIKIDKAIKMIKSELKAKYKISCDNFKPNIVAYGGSYINAEVEINNIDSKKINGKILADARINYNDYKKVSSIVTEIDPKAFILARNEYGLHYIEPQIVSKQKLEVLLLKALQMSKGEGGEITNGLSKEEYEKLFMDKNVHSLEILSLSSSLNKKIIKRLCEEVLNLSSSGGFTVQVSKGDKIEALKRIYGDDLSEVLYVGDGYNDVIPIKECGMSFALGDKLIVLKSANYAVENFNDITDAVFRNVDLTKKSDALIKYARIKDEEKQKKKEMGKVYYSVNKLKSKVTLKSDEEKEMGNIK